MATATEVFLAIAAIPFIYYFIAIYSSWRYFQQPSTAPDESFTPPVSILKPIRGLDPDAAENLASFCRLDYPEFEIVFCVDPDDAAGPREILSRDQRRANARIASASSLTVRISATVLIGMAMSKRSSSSTTMSMTARESMDSSS